MQFHRFHYMGVQNVYVIVPAINVIIIAFSSVPQNGESGESGVCAPVPVRGACPLGCEHV